MKEIVLALVLSWCLWSVGASAQTDFSTWDAYELVEPNGKELISPAGGPVIKMHSYPIKSLEQTAGRALTSAGSDRQQQIEYALSVLSLGLFWDESFDGTALTGLVDGADGTYRFKAQFTPNNKILTVGLVVTDKQGRVLEDSVALSRRSPGTATSASYVSDADGQSPLSLDEGVELSPRAKRYAPPESVAEMDRWASSGKVTRSADPSDPLSPRYYLAQTGPKYGVYDFETAIEKLQMASRVVLKGSPVVEKLEAWKTYDGSTSAIVMQQTQFEHLNGVVVLFMTRKKGKEDIVYFGYEVSEDDFLRWGGITRMMQLRGVVPSVDAFAKSTRNRISRAPFKQQADVYEAGLNKVLESGVARMYAMTQAQALLRMRELNYDLLLGGDITSPMISN